MVVVVLFVLIMHFAVPDWRSCFCFHIRNVQFAFGDIYQGFKREAYVVQCN